MLACNGIEGKKKGKKFGRKKTPFKSGRGK
jgi:hypothetical protein